MKLIADELCAGMLQGHIPASLPQCATVTSLLQPFFFFVSNYNF